MSRSTKRASPAIRVARRWFRRLVYSAWRVVRTLIVLSAAVGPNAPPPPLPRPPPIEARAEAGDPPDPAPP